MSYPLMTSLQMDSLLRELSESMARFPLATKGDAMRLMRIWNMDYVTAPARREWYAITGEDQITTKVLWDYIRAALVNEA